MSKDQKSIGICQSERGSVAGKSGLLAPVLLATFVASKYLQLEIQNNEIHSTSAKPRLQSLPKSSASRWTLQPPGRYSDRTTC
jgi:hypothetical protein